MFQIKVQAKTIDELVNKLGEMRERLTPQTVTPPVEITQSRAATVDEVEDAGKIAAALVLEAVAQPLTPSDMPLVLSEVANRTPPAKYLPSEEPLTPPPEEPLKLHRDFDSAGVPWDARIHGKDRNKVKTGTWRYKRGVDKTIIAGIEAELRQQAQAAIPQAIVAEQSAQAVVAPTLAPPVQAISVKTLPVTPRPTATLVVTSSPETLESRGLHIPPPVECDPKTDLYKLEYFIANYVDALTNLLKKGTLTQEYLEVLKAYFKVDQIWDLDTEQKTLMFEEFVKNKIITKVI